jgi:hypothetical protein
MGGLGFGRDLDSGFLTKNTKAQRTRRKEDSIGREEEKRDEERDDKRPAARRLDHAEI